MGDRTVLVVEDDLPLRQMLVWALSDQDYRTLEADDGLQAIRILDERSGAPDDPDLILLDMMLPRMNGLEVLRHMTNHGHTTPVVVLSANSTLRQAAATAGARATMGKPFEIGNLLEMVERHCK
jgi:DNA-binding response OmpR family regulator